MKRSLWQDPWGYFFGREPEQVAAFRSDDYGEAHGASASDRIFEQDASRGLGGFELEVAKAIAQGFQEAAARDGVPVSVEVFGPNGETLYSSGGPNYEDTGPSAASERELNERERNVAFRMMQSLAEGISPFWLDSR